MTSIKSDNAPAELTELLEYTQSKINGELEARLGQKEGANDASRRLREAMHYAATSPGKRIRPAIVFAACDALGGPRTNALPAALAVEVMHSYTLVHDDLPCMDDDDERRGKPSTHKKYDEATALLAGDALLTFAFELLSEFPNNAALAVSALSKAAGSKGILAGQALDLAISPSPTFEQLETIHRAKTGELFAVSAELGSLAAGANGKQRKEFNDFGMLIGVAFQYADDLDDGEFPHLSEKSSSRRSELSSKAIAWAQSLGDKGKLLVSIAKWLSLIHI